jgi:hypothetical protein
MDENIAAVLVEKKVMYQYARCETPIMVQLVSAGFFVGFVFALGLMH